MDLNTKARKTHAGTFSAAVSIRGCYFVTPKSPPPRPPDYGYARNEYMYPRPPPPPPSPLPSLPHSPPLSFTSQPCFGTPCPPSRGLARLLGEMAEAGVGRGAGAITHLVVVVMVTAAVAAEGRGGNNMAHRRHPPSRTRWDT